MNARKRLGYSHTPQKRDSTNIRQRLAREIEGWGTDLGLYFAAGHAWEVASQKSQRYIQWPTQTL